MTRLEHLRPFDSAEELRWFLAFLVATLARLGFRLGPVAPWPERMDTDGRAAEALLRRVTATPTPAP